MDLEAGGAADRGRGHNVYRPTLTGLGEANSSLSMAGFAARARSTPGWRVRELDTGHEAPVTAPRELAGLILEAATIGQGVA